MVFTFQNILTLQRFRKEERGKGKGEEERERKGKKFTVREREGKYGKMLTTDECILYVFHGFEISQNTKWRKRAEKSLALPELLCPLTPAPLAICPQQNIQLGQS